MKFRPLSVLAPLFFGLTLGISAFAAEDGASAELQAEWASRLARAAELQREGKAQQASAERLYAEKDAACFGKFLVNACRAAARSEYVAAARLGKNLENKGKSAERQVRKEQLIERDGQRRAAAPQHEADLRLREAETGAARRAAAADEAQQRADKEMKAEAGGRRKAAEAEKLRRKQAEHDARVAAGKAKAERREAEAGSRMP